MGFRQALTTRSLGFKKKGNRIETETVYASLNPKAFDNVLSMITFSNLDIIFS